MKSLTIIYCGENGEAGKALAASLRTGEQSIVIGDAATFYGVADPWASAVIIMPDVSGWHRGRLEKAYGAKVVKSAIPVAQPQAATSGALRAVHKGFGKWFVMDGDRKVSGPHAKDEAQRLAA